MNISRDEYKLLKKLYYRQRTNYKKSYICNFREKASY